MPDDHSRQCGGKDVLGTIGALVLVGVGTAAWWSTTYIPRVDAYVFPRAVIIIMVSLSVCLIVWNLLGFGSGGEKPLPGSAFRRVGLVAVMLLASYFMQYLGFVVTTLIAYIIIMLLAMYERWTLFRKIVYPLAGIVVVYAFYYLFAVLFNIPLPKAPWV